MLSTRPPDSTSSVHLRAAADVTAEGQYLILGSDEQWTTGFAVRLEALNDPRARVFSGCAADWQQDCLLDCFMRAHVLMNRVYAEPCVPGSVIFSNFDRFRREWTRWTFRSAYCAEVRLFMRGGAVLHLLNSNEGLLGARTAEELASALEALELDDDDLASTRFLS